MKFINKKIIVLLMLGSFMACNNLDLDLQQDPNNISPDQASLNDLYNAVQLGFANFFLNAESNPGTAARMYMQVAFTYRAMAPPNSSNGLWSAAYSDLFPDIDAIIALSEGKGFDIHVGTAKIMKAYALMVLVDYFGDVPLSDAGTGEFTPALDPGGNVYASANTLLDEGIALLTGTTAPAPAFDNYFDGDADNWIAFANTLKFRAALNTGDVGTINSLTGAIISSDNSNDDFQFNFGTNRTNPDSRNPFYANHYETGDGSYLSNYYMWLLRAEKVNAAGITIVDPRIRYYFYRKVKDSENQDQTTFSCHFSALPDQAFKPAVFIAVDPNLPYCIASTDGYSGRDHLNGEGIPPDGPIRTSFGLYPFGGDFDDDSFDDTRESGTRGGLGQGIVPIMLSSFGDFMHAEAVLRLGASGDAKKLLEDGIRASLDKVESFEDLVSGKMGTTVVLKDGSSGTIKGLFGMDDGDKDDYVNEVLAMYDAATAAGKLDIVIKEFYIAVWGNGLEAYNMYRRTGLPGNIEPALEPPGPFPLSFFYPADSETRNPNITQKDELDVPVFWQDLGIASGLR